MKTKSVSAALLVLASALAVDAAWAGSHEVKIQGFQFQPAKLQVAVGDTITWTNADGMPHTVTSKAAGVESDAIAPGGKWTYTVKSKGDIDYACRFHPSMKGAVSAK
jgi:plastocyanin